MSIYMIVETKEIEDKKKYEEYIRKVPKTIERFKGRYLVRGGKAEVIEGNWHPQRLIVVEFESMDRFRAWWSSPEYRAIAFLREESVKTNAIVVEGECFKRKDRQDE